MTSTLATSGNESVILRRDKLGRIKIPASKRAEILAEYDRSGMSGLEFAKWAGLTYSTFATWIQKRRQAKPTKDSSSTPKWVEVVSQNPPSSFLTLELSGGVKLTIQDENQARLAGVFLKSLSC